MSMNEKPVMNTWMKLSALSLAAAMLMTGCATPQAVDPAVLPTVPAVFKEGDGRWTASAPAEAQPRGTWWHAFADPVLDRLIEHATDNNTVIAQAAARLAQAHAQLRATEANRAPQLGVSAGATRGTDASVGGVPASVLSVGAALGYEVDLFGRLRAASDAAVLDAQSREALLQSTRLLVQAEVAQTYFALRALDEERALVRDTVQTYRDTLRLTENRFSAGDVAELDVARVRAQVAATEAEATALDRRRAELEHALALLVGEPASSFDLASGAWGRVLPVVPAGVPSTVLARRPDVSAAQRGMQAAQARVGIARSAWLPSLSLTTTGGLASPELGDLFSWSARAWSVGALVALPLLDGGRREAGVQSAVAALDAAVAGYREQVLVAFRDVEDQLSALRLLAEQAQQQSRAVASAARATALSSSRYHTGLVSQLELLDAQRSELSNRRLALQVRAAQYQVTVGLVRALGGDWG
jgi:multidrug efflux system outer membrane protein